MFLNNSLTLDRFLDREVGTFRESYMGSLVFCFSHTLTDTRMEVIDFLFGLLKCRFDLLLGKCHKKVVYQKNITLKEVIYRLIACFYVDAQ